MAVLADKIDTFRLQGARVGETHIDVRDLASPRITLDGLAVGAARVSNELPRAMREPVTTISSSAG